MTTVDLLREAQRIESESERAARNGDKAAAAELRAEAEYWYQRADRRRAWAQRDRK